MAEMLVTMAFISALAMIVAGLQDKFLKIGWLTLLLLVIIGFTLPVNAFAYDGGLALIISVGAMLSCASYKMENKESVLMAGILISVSLLTMFPSEAYSEDLLKKSMTPTILYLIVGFLVTSRFDRFKLGGALAASIIVGFTPAMICAISISIISTMKILDSKINLGTGTGRSVGLGITILIGIIVIFISTWVQAGAIPRIGEGPGAVAVSLWMLVVIVSLGLIGMLAPLVGFDAHPRPEAWGWRMGLAISPIILTMVTDLAVFTLVGISIAILISMTGPLVLEKKVEKTA
jgi:hypothetical protein